MTASDAMLNFNSAPLWFLCGIAGFLFLLAVLSRVKEWLENRASREPEEGGEEFPDVELEVVPRREALELIAKLGAVRERMLGLNRALTKRREGTHWRFGIAGSADDTFCDAAEGSVVDQFLFNATESDLTIAQSEMISLFRDVANWLEKYAPEESPPPSVRERITNAARTFLGRFFPALKLDNDRKQIAVVRKTV